MAHKMTLALFLLALAACGVEGPPMTPQANLGVAISPAGLTPNASVGATNGILSLGVNL